MRAELAAPKTVNQRIIPSVTNIRKGRGWSINRPKCFRLFPLIRATQRGRNCPNCKTTHCSSRYGSEVRHTGRDLTRGVAQPGPQPDHSHADRDAFCEKSGLTPKGANSRGTIDPLAPLSLRFFSPCADTAQVVSYSRVGSCGHAAPPGSF